MPPIRGFVEVVCRSKRNDPYIKIPGANMGPIWILSAPDGPHVGPIPFAMRGYIVACPAFIRYDANIVKYPAKYSYWCWIYPYHYQRRISEFLCIKYFKPLTCILLPSDAGLQWFSQCWCYYTPCGAYSRYHELSFAFPYPGSVVIERQSICNPVCLELRPKYTLEWHWRNNFWLQVCFQYASSSVPMIFQWWSSVFQLCTGC